jgi:hypothetical protein
MTQATGKRRGHGEDSIYWDATRDRYIGAVDLGFNAAGTRARKKVSGKTKAEVRDKLRELHKDLNAGLKPRRGYTVGDALADWLSHGVDGLSERTVTLYRGTIAKALVAELGSVRLASLTASDVQGALSAVASRSSTRTVQIVRNVLVRAIKHAERDDLVGRNVAALVDAPRGHLEGRPSQSLTLEQTLSLLAAARGTGVRLGHGDADGRSQRATAVPGYYRGGRVGDGVGTARVAAYVRFAAFGARGAGGGCCLACRA